MTAGTNAARALLLAAIAALAAGCASTGGGLFDAHLDSPSAAVRGCAQWYRTLDRETDAAGGRDAQYAPVPGFPYLRVDRFSASLRERAAAGEPALHALVERLLELDIDARRHEIENLPRERFDALPGAGELLSRAAALRRTLECARLLREIDFAKPEARAEMLQRAQVADDYSSLSRIFGLYALTRVFFREGVTRWEQETLEAFRREPELPSGANWVRYAPPVTYPPLPRAAVAGILGRAGFDALGVPGLSGRELSRLAATYAPSFEIAVGGDHDRFGELRWRRDGEIPEVDAAEAAVYVQPAYTRYGDHVLLQLVYTLWFPERPPQGESDLFAGRLDGIVWRATLAPDGEPLLYDSIHPCGCFHMFIPTPRAQLRPAPDTLEEWAFVPQALPRVAEGERPVVTIASGTHSIERVSVVRGGDSVVRYVLHAYDELRSLPLLTGGKRSAFGPDGLIAGSERAERFLFWPMGIASAGAMRQWGRQATAFVGRRHFDDPDLIERRFELELAERLP